MNDDETDPEPAGQSAMEPGASEVRGLEVCSLSLSALIGPELSAGRHCGRKGSLAARGQHTHTHTHTHTQEVRAGRLMCVRNHFFVCLPLVPCVDVCVLRGVVNVCVCARVCVCVCVCSDLLCRSQAFQPVVFSSSPRETNALRINQAG